MVESLMQGVLFNTSPLVCVGSLLLIGATFAAASVVALKKQSY
jgi:ABC-2 type transport system permease protein/bacitracin transport system permease protein